MVYYFNQIKQMDLIIITANEPHQLNQVNIMTLVVLTVFSVCCHLEKGTWLRLDGLIRFVFVVILCPVCNVYCR